MIQVKSIVVVQLAVPREKYWGQIEEMTQIGVYMRGMELEMVLNWAHELVRGETVTLGLSNVFFPINRIEKIFLDEDVGIAKSVSTNFTEIVGRDAVEYFEGVATIPEAAATSDETSY